MPTRPFVVKLAVVSAFLVLVFGATHGQNAPSMPPNANLAVEESTPSEGKWTRSIESDLIAEKFDDLDRMAEEYRRNKTRLPGGDWRLRKFYTALDAPQQTDKDSFEHLEHLRKWMQLRPESITARVALATSLTRWAWVARGNGLANTVTPEGWQLFGERAGEALVVLEGSRDMKRMCPQWYLEMMVVGLAQGWNMDRVKEVFDRGVQFEPDYQYLYYQRANYLLPKWYGKLGDSTTFAKTSADHLGGEAGDILYYQIAASIVHQGNGKLQVQPADLDWPRIQQGYRALVAQYGKNRAVENQFAYMAFRFEDKVVAQQQFASIGDSWAPGVWRDRKIFDRARDWSQGHTSWP